MTEGLSARMGTLMRSWRPGQSQTRGRGLGCREIPQGP